MFDIGSSELLLIIIVAVVVIGPKDLPRALYKVGQIVGKAKGMARHFRTGLDAMIREAELEDLEKKWADQNRRIMAEHPAQAVLTDDSGAAAEPAAEPAAVMEPLAVPETPAPASAPAPTIAAASAPAVPVIPEGPAQARLDIDGER